MRASDGLAHAVPLALRAVEPAIWRLPVLFMLRSAAAEPKTGRRKQVPLEAHSKIAVLLLPTKDAEAVEETRPVADMAPATDMSPALLTVVWPVAEASPLGLR